MGSATAVFWALTTLTMIATAALVVAISYFAHKEYTEEIDRLRQDLLSSREHNGVYIAFENYNQMTQLLEHNRQEINEKLQLIQALKKEKADKEALCNELQRSLKEQNEGFGGSEKILKQTAEVLGKQLEIEKALKEQAHSLLAVAEASALHDKLDRKRSVEEESSHISHNFRMDFNRKISLLQENIGDFVGSVTEYLSKIKTDLDSSLQKRNSELTTLSDNFASFVDVQSGTLQEWSKKSTEQATGTQLYIQQLLQDIRTQTDTETNSLHNFLTEVFLPLAQNHQNLILRQKRENEGFSRLVTEQFQRSLEVLQSFARQQQEALSLLHENFATHMEQLQQELDKSREAEKNAANGKKKFHEKFLSDIEKMRESYQRHINDEMTASETLDNGLELIKQNAERALVIAKSAINVEEHRLSDLVNQNQKQAEESAEIIKGFLERTGSIASGVEDCHSDQEKSVRGIISSTKDAWSKQYGMLENQLRHMSENLREAQKQCQDHNQVLNGQLQSFANSQEAHLEAQRRDYTTYVHDSAVTLEQRSTMTSNWGHSMSNEVQICDKDVETFLLKHLQQDTRAGKTRKEREFIYPSRLVSTSSTQIFGELNSNYNSLEQHINNEDSPSPRNRSILVKMKYKGSSGIKPPQRKSLKIQN